MTGFEVDGNDVLSIYEVAEEAIRAPVRRRTDAAGVQDVSHEAARRRHGRFHVSHPR